jgi:hypothetical protein
MLLLYFVHDLGHYRVIESPLLLFIKEVSH